MKNNSLKKSANLGFRVMDSIKPGRIRFPKGLKNMNGKNMNSQRISFPTVAWLLLHSSYFLLPCCCCGSCVTCLFLESHFGIHLHAVRIPVKINRRLLRRIQKMMEEDYKLRTTLVSLSLNHVHFHL